MENLKYENISFITESKINLKSKKLTELKENGSITDRELQYSFLLFLQGLSLSKKEVFDVYTNTTI